MKEKEETLYDVLMTNDKQKINDFLMRNGKKKSYCPIQFDRDKSESDDNQSLQS